MASSAAVARCVAARPVHAASARERRRAAAPSVQVRRTATVAVARLAANRPVPTLVAVGTVTRPLGNNCAVDLLLPSCWSLIVAATDTDAPAMLFVCLASLRHTLTLNPSVLSISSISAFASLTPSATTVTKPTATSLHPRALLALLPSALLVPCPHYLFPWLAANITTRLRCPPTQYPSPAPLKINIHPAATALPP